jgi:hypothetical protein
LRFNDDLLRQIGCILHDTQRKNLINRQRFNGLVDQDGSLVPRIAVAQQT